MIDRCPEHISITFIPREKSISVISDMDSTPIFVSKHSYQVLAQSVHLFLSFWFLKLREFKPPS